MKKLQYDIRTSKHAQKTLSSLTSIPITVWKQYLYKERQFDYPEDFVEDMIERYGKIPSSYKDFEFIYFHVTTSANDCVSIRKHGILDLKQSYLCSDSELKTFLEKHNIQINLDKKELIYYERKEQKYDITFEENKKQKNMALECRRVGRKLYYDYVTCGFLSADARNPYGGNVHLRPEILKNIDDLLMTDLSYEWQSTHDPYVVVAEVSGEKILYDGDVNQCDHDMVIHYLMKAYHTAFNMPSEEVLILQNNIQIPHSDIIEIKPIKLWDELCSDDFFVQDCFVL